MKGLLNAMPCAQEQLGAPSAGEALAGLIREEVNKTTEKLQKSVDWAQCVKI